MLTQNLTNLSYLKLVQDPPGVIKIPKKFPFWGGEGFRAKKIFVLSLVDQMVTAYQF